MLINFIIEYSSPSYIAVNFFSEQTYLVLMMVHYGYWNKFVKTKEMFWCFKLAIYLNYHVMHVVFKQKNSVLIFAIRIHAVILKSH